MKKWNDVIGIKENLINGTKQPRSLATAACEKGKIRINAQAVRPSRMIKAGDTIALRNGAYTLPFEVLQLSETGWLPNWYRNIVRTSLRKVSWRRSNCMPCNRNFSITAAKAGRLKRQAGTG